jgi:hypothetical protein
MFGSYGHIDITKQVKERNTELKNKKESLTKDFKVIITETYLDDEPENYKIYSGVTRESERMLLAHNAEHPSTICIVRLPAFASRHHSVLIPTQGEKTIEEITKVISDTLGKWLATLQLLID